MHYKYNRFSRKNRIADERYELQSEINSHGRMKQGDEVWINGSLQQFLGCARGVYTFKEIITDPRQDHVFINKRTKTFARMLSDGSIEKSDVVATVPIRMVHTGESFVQYEGEGARVEDIGEALAGWKFINAQEDDCFGQIKPAKKLSWCKILEKVRSKITASFEPVSPDKNFEMIYFLDLEDELSNIANDYEEACLAKSSFFELKFNSVWYYKEK